MPCRDPRPARYTVGRAKMEVLLHLFISSLSRRCCISISLGWYVPNKVPEVQGEYALVAPHLGGPRLRSTFIQAGAVSGDGPSIDCIE